MAYPADPGNVFASDAHRRVMASTPLPGDDPLELDGLLDRIAGDDFLDVDGQGLEDVLKDLEADGHVKHLKSGWKQTSAGFKALTGPNQGDQE